MIRPGMKRVFSTLDGLRGIAALAVVTRHVPDHTLLGWSQASTLAVDLFFALSGFVLAHSYLQRLQDGMTTFEFMKLRVIRLYPLYILGTSLVALNLAIAAGTDWHRWAHVIGSGIFAVFFLPAPPFVSPDQHPFPLNFVAWSLFYELAVNLLFALVALRLTNRLLGVIIAIGAVMLIATGLYFGDLTSGSLFANFWGGGGRVVYSFFAGVAAYRVWQADRLAWAKLPAWVCFILLVVVFMGAPLQGRAYYDLATALIVFPLLVLAAARMEPPRWLFGLSEFLGTGSYAIYVIQVPVIVWVSSILHRLGTNLNSFGLPGSIAIMVAVAVAAHLLDKHFDKEARSRLSRALRQRRAATP
jgi:peptidoglycan/LPS O-acetylase OafA/YrhL